MKARLLKGSKVKMLFTSIAGNLERYREGDFNFLLEDPTAFYEIDHEIDQSKLASIDCDKQNHKEVENCILAFAALGKISLYMARDERLWIYLSHTLMLEYTRNRWPIPASDEKAIQHIKNHIFVVGARGFERDNSVSRLWWMASLCNRIEGMSLKQSLTCLLYQYDVRANIIERPTTSQSVLIFSAILKKLHNSYKGNKALFERNKFRAVMKELNLRGGVKLLAALPEQEITSILDDCALS